MTRSVFQPPAKRAAALAAPLLALATLGLAAPAHADTALSADVTCDAGNSRWVCDASVSGGSGSYSYSWSAVTNAGFFSGLASSSAYGPCRTNMPAGVQVTVTDTATGASVSAPGRFFCYAIAP
ncbi:hypothetical protein ABZW30_39035 [Kitasatospora sp. NPDC004669]|uniref:hypothetical protein n=1 Tax=Kitasatospora sp. NPDC004669 TaxID=3154555 RepID=UPI0033AA57F1